MTLESDFLVIGGGIMGLSIARELRNSFHGSKVVLIEKEGHCGEHASGRNSGVLHAGFYYTADSLKARFTRDGNRALTEYCESHGLKINKCGKLVVTQNEDELQWLDELMSRAEKNGVDLQMVDQKEAESIEPRVKTCQRALFSPTTSSVDPGEVMAQLHKDALAEGVEVHVGVRYLQRTAKGIETSAGDYNARYIINCAGLYADTIGRDFGFSKHYRILPFKGLYLYSDEPPGSLRTHIYPVPDLRNPFLGVHFTVTAQGAVKIGPTAIPAFWREQIKEGKILIPPSWSKFCFARQASFFPPISISSGSLGKKSKNTRGATWCPSPPTCSRASVKTSTGNGVPRESGLNYWTSEEKNLKWISFWKTMINRCIY